MNITYIGYKKGSNFGASLSARQGKRPDCFPFYLSLIFSCLVFIVLTRCELGDSYPKKIIWYPTLSNGKLSYK